MLNLEAVFADIRVTLGCFLGETKLRKNVSLDFKHYSSVERDHGKSGKDYFTVNWQL
jgi:hypothetical protein